MANNNLTINGARIIFRDFSGERSPYNNDKTFCVILEDPDLAKALVEDGWNVRYLKPRNEDDEPQPYLQVKIGFGGNYPPKIYTVTNKNKQRLDEEDVAMLDWAEIDNVDVIIRPYNYNVNGKRGVKAYVKTMMVTLAEDELEARYESVPEADSDHSIPFDEDGN